MAYVKFGEAGEDVRNYDEFYLRKVRCMTSPEAFLRTWVHWIVRMSHTVEKLFVHHEVPVVFNENDSEAAAMHEAEMATDVVHTDLTTLDAATVNKDRTTKLLAFFELNRTVRCQV